MFDRSNREIEYALSTASSDDSLHRSFRMSKYGLVDVFSYSFTEGDCSLLSAL